MANSKLSDLFFKELKQYNTTNFKTLLTADLTKEDAVVHKACSSVVTRYFIFIEKHPELSESDAKLLYFQARVDMVARYFAEYPVSNISDLQPFQDELRRFAEKLKEETDGKQQLAV